MVKLDLLDDNLVLIIQAVLNNQALCKYIYYDKDNPLEQSNIADTQVSLMMKRVFPYPFDPGVICDDQTQLRIYYTDGRINETAVEEIQVYFDIIVAKETLWLIYETVFDELKNKYVEKSRFRPYRIMKEIANIFNKNSIDTVGQLEFSGFSHRYVNEKFDAIQMVARMTNFTNG